MGQHDYYDYYHSRAHRTPPGAGELPGEYKPFPFYALTNGLLFRQAPAAAGRQATANALNCPEGYECALFGMGCFWGAEHLFSQTPGVLATTVGFAGGHTRNPTYRENRAGDTGHAEVVRVVFDPAVVSYAQLLEVFWNGHDPTQGDRQGNDIGPMYRSLIGTFSAAQRAVAEESRAAHQQLLSAAGHGVITTELQDAPEFYPAEERHQQYFAKNPAVMPSRWIP